MHVLSHLRLRAKLTLLLGLFGVGLVASIAMAASLMQSRMLDDRVDKLRAVVQSAIGIARRLDGDVVAQRLTREQALDRLGASIHGMRFDGGNGYVIVRRDAVILLHGADPGLEGKPSATRDARGRPLTELIRDALQGSDDGIVTYLFPKPGHSQPQSKVSYVVRFAPWDVVFFAGAYTDDIDAAFRANVLRLGATGGLILAVTLLAAWLVNRDITASLGGLRVAMERLATADLAAGIPGTARPDEVGAMARAVLVFKDQMANGRRLEAAATAVRERRERQQAAMERHTRDFGESVSGVLASLGASATTMRDAAEGMARAVERTRSGTASTAAGAEESSRNLAGIAAATDALTTSGDEIARQVARATQGARESMQRTEATGSTVRSLSEAVGRIGDVARLIADIASQTNLLALNATIEAARAGEAGRGFAVVASEVKLLAAQTAKATEQIGSQIAAIQAATDEAVGAVHGVGEAIMHMDAVASAIAGAVEELGAATREIAASVQAVSRQNDDATGAMREVSVVAEAASGSSQAVLAAGGEIARVSGALQEEVAHFFAAMRAEEGERRRWERIPGGRAQVSLKPRNGGEVAGELDDISRGGALVACPVALDVGAEVDVRLPGAGDAVPARVVRSAGGNVAVVFRMDPASLARIDRAMDAIRAASAPVGQTVPAAA
jgi:methyl-accepting chemotaxis protein